jgi:outer membrane protein TolC
MLKSMILIVFLGTSPSSFSSIHSLSESSLEEISSKGSPQMDQIEAAFLNISFREGETAQKFAPEIFGKSSIAETNERAIVEFQPVFTPVKQAQLGVRKIFKEGIETAAYFVTDQRSAENPFIGKLNNVTTTTLAFTAQIDLWKNLLGRVSRAELESAQLDKKKAEIEKEIQFKTFRISLRRLYWSLVANQESSVISQQLLETAKKQLDESKLRQKNAVGEADEVARYEAQLASREGTLLYLKYQKEVLLKQLRNLLPELTNKEIQLEKYDLDKTFSEVLSCTAIISGLPGTPYQNTKYDEVISLLKEIRASNSLVNSRYASADVKLFGTVKSTGVGSQVVKDKYTRGSYASSIDDQNEQNRTGYEVGVNFTLPVGDVKEDTQRVKELYDEKRLLASIQSTDTQVITTHQQLSVSIKLLLEVIRTQKKSSEELRKRLLLMRRKYEQARVGVDELVFDQDALLNSQLMTIDTQLQILNTLFDYLVIYTETPCSFNRI